MAISISKIKKLLNELSREELEEINLEIIRESIKETTPFAIIV